MSKHEWQHKTPNDLGVESRKYTGLMRGHRQIIRARLGGQRPRAIFVNVVDAVRVGDNRFDDVENGLQFNLHPNVDIAVDALDKPLDLRFLLNCTVHIHGKTMDDALGLFIDRVAEKAVHVIACADDALLEFHHGKWTAWTF